MDTNEQLREFLAAVRRRWFADEGLRVAARASAAAAIPGLAGLVTYGLFAPTGALLVLLGLATVVAAAGAALAVARGMHPRPTDEQVARFVEERAASLPGVLAFDDALVTAVDSHLAADPAFRPLLVAAAVRRLDDITPAHIVSTEGLRRRAFAAAAGLSALVVVLAMSAPPLRRAIETAWIMLRPGAIQIDVHPGDVKLVAGKPLEIRVTMKARGRVFTQLTPQLAVTAGNQQRSVAMDPSGGGFAFAFESVDRTFTYQVAAGRARSQEYTVSALFPPRIERIELRYEYPAFTGLRPRTEDDGGDIYAPKGTKVRFRVHVDKPVSSGEMMLAGGTARPFSRAAERVLEGDLVLARDDAYRIRLADADGLRIDTDSEYFIRLMDDRPPDVRILRPAGDQQITPLEEVAIDARAEDDYGIDALELVYSVPGGQTKTVPFAKTSGSDVVRLGSHLLAAEDLNVKPGDVITYYARARDVGRGKRSTETRSDMYFLEVRPFSEEFVAAESQSAGGGASSQQIESLIAGQKEIISATWNIERRSDAGRSSKDVQAVAQAQAELKARAEQMTSRRTRGRFQPPQRMQMPQPGPPRVSSGDPVSNAVASMQRAVEHLQGEKTKDALAHEMAALQGLLQAQAEVRRREVMQQSANNSSGSGSGRQGEDLSALFDKELQRHQRTNYESRSQIEERPDQKKQDDALERIRDLARRQEEINRQVEELEKLSAEERKRQLERLTREQDELRQQMEELARRKSEQNAQGQSQSQDGKAGQSPSGRQQSQNSAGMKDAAEQMRGSASELQRGDQKAAAEQSARAAERLRDLERQMRSDSPESRQRAAGELQLEAQQIAGEQRRVAAEANRLGKGQGSTAEARRRLSGEKAQLADRMDALQRDVTSLAKDAAGARFKEAAQELEREQIGRRMREGAKQIREGGGAGAAEEQLARTLDKVVQQLGGTRADARESGNQLDQTRAIRNRLDQLERQIADAEARQQQAGGREGGRSGKAGADAESELQRLRQEYARELQQARETLGRMQQSAPQSGLGGTSPEKHEWSQADPGTQAFKQDFSGWQSLRKDINLALERTEAAASARLAKQAAQDRLSAGGSDRVPDAYSKLIARYYESLARPKK
jgi:hypothetical protein